MKQKKENNTISIIVIIYNVARFLEECIKSIQNQTYKNLEIILVDDGSTDESGRICDEYAAKDKRIIVIHKKNGGLISARKAGIKIATGTYCAFVDGDDWIDEDTYESMYKFVNEYYVDIIAAGIIRNYPHKTIRETNLLPVGYYDKELLEKDVYPKIMYDMERKACFVDPSLCNKLFRTIIIKKCLEETDEHIFYLGEDAANTYPAFLRAESIYVTDKAMYHHRILEVSQGDTSYKRERVYERLLLFYKYLKRIFEKSEYADIVLPQLNGYFLHLLSTITKEAIGLNIFDFYHNLFYRDQRTNRTTTYGDGIKYKMKEETLGKYQKVVLYGAGNVGKDCFYQLSKKGVAVYWIDSNYLYYKGFGLDVHSINTLPKEGYDAYILATVKPENAAEMHQLLLKKGITESKIIHFSE